MTRVLNSENVNI